MSDTTPPPAPDMREDDEPSWPRRHPVLTGIAGLVAILVLVSALGGDGESTADLQEATAQSETSEPVEQATVTAEPEPAETVTVTSAPEPSEPPTPSPDPEPAETTVEADDDGPQDQPAPTPEAPDDEAADDPASAYVDGEFDAELEALAEACVDGGDGDACWDLFLDSPLDSEYEALGLDGSGSPDVDPGSLGDVDVSLLLPILWDGMSQDERELICFGWTLDEDSSLDSFMEGADEMIGRDEAKDFFDEQC